jgi:glucosamine-phosphate N-acetyltransferase
VLEDKRYAPDDLVIREAVVADYEHGLEEVLRSLGGSPLTPADVRLALRRRRRSGMHTYVAVLNGRVAGTASLWVEAKLTHGGLRAAHLEDVAVAQEYRRCGLGSALVRHALRVARALGCYKAVLDCRDDVTHFYLKLGFRAHERAMRLGL